MGLTINLLSNRHLGTESQTGLTEMTKVVAVAQEELKAALDCDPNFGVTFDEFIVWFEGNFIDGVFTPLITRAISFVPEDGECPATKAAIDAAFAPAFHGVEEEAAPKATALEAAKAAALERQRLAKAATKEAE